MEKIYICLPVRNEEKNLEKCLISINNSMKQIKKIYIKTYICLNGCRDKSREIAGQCKHKYPLLDIKILESKMGKLTAQKKMLSKISLNHKVFFVDADTEVSSESFEIILREFEKHRKLIAVGAFPMAKRYTGFNPWKRFLDKVLNIRSRHPKSEISRLNVENYHKLSLMDPQIHNTTQEHELKSKIFFHGRMFALRSKKYWNNPSKEKNVVGDDSYLPDYIIYNYGKNKIRIRYDAMVYFNPFTSLMNHYRTYKRIHFDLKNLKENFLKFKEIRDHSELILDMNYIKKQKFAVRFYFFWFNFIRKVEKILFKFSIEKNPHKIWKKN